MYTCTYVQNRWRLKLNMCDIHIHAQKRLCICVHPLPFLPLTDMDYHIFPTELCMHRSLHFNTMGTLSQFGCVWLCDCSHWNAPDVQKCVHSVTNLIGPIVCRTCTPDAAEVPEISWAPEITTSTTSEQCCNTTWTCCNCARSVSHSQHLHYCWKGIHVQHRQALLA